jgi:hypothetical protein
MRASLLALCTLLACTTAKDSTAGDPASSSGGDDGPFTSTFGMSSDTDPTDPTATPTGGTTEPLDTSLSPASTDTGDPGLDLPSGGSSGLYLLAVSTIISPQLPLQFLATVDAADPAQWDLTLQPLALDQGQTGSPQTPFGGPLVFNDIAVIDGKFTIDLGDIQLSGPTNPITGSDIAANIAFSGAVVDPDFFCGLVDGMVTSPLRTSIDGSTFAAVRVAGLDALPDDIPINCNGDTVSDP